MIGWWMLGEILQRRSAWLVPNLLATTFYGERAYRPGFIVPTWAGLAFPLTVYCAMGVLFALLGRDRRAGWGLLLVGAAAGLALNWFFFGFALKRINPLVSLYSPDRLITMSQLLYGLALVSYPGFARNLSGATEARKAAPETAPPGSPDPSHEATSSTASDGTGVMPGNSDGGHSDGAAHPDGAGHSDGVGDSDQKVGGGVPQGPDDSATGSVLP